MTEQQNPIIIFHRKKQNAKETLANQQAFIEFYKKYLPIKAIDYMTGDSQQAKEPYDAVTLIKLVKAVSTWRNKWPINIIIDRALCNSPDYILATMTLDILSTTGLIKIYCYEKNAENEEGLNSNEIYFHFLNPPKGCFFFKAANYMKTLVAFLESKIN